MQQKLGVIKLHEKGSLFAKIESEKWMEKSSVRKLVKNKDQYKSQVMITESYLSKVMSKIRRTQMVNM